MRALMGVIKNRHGTFYARRKVPERLQEAVARIRGDGKGKQVWLQSSLGTKDLDEANVRAKPVLMGFDKIIAQAEDQLKARPLRTSLSAVEIKRVADFFYAHEMTGDEEEREDGRGSDPMYASIHKQLTEAGVEFNARYKISDLTLEPGRGLSRRMMQQIEEDTTNMLAVAQDDLARGDIRHLHYEVDALLGVFQINLDPNCPDYRKLCRAVQAKFVQHLKDVLARHRGEPIPSPPLIEPAANGEPTGETLSAAFAGWKKAQSPSFRTEQEYERAVRLFQELHGDLPIAQIRPTHVRSFIAALQDVPRQRVGSIKNAPLPALMDWSKKHPEAPRVTAKTVNKLLGGVQAVALWGRYKAGMVPDEIPWSDPFARMRLPEEEPTREPFNLKALQALFSAPVFIDGVRPVGGRGAAAFWLPLIALFAGTRLSEAALLLVSDIRRDDETGKFAFWIEHAPRGSRRLKTGKKSERVIPVHPELIRLGLLDYRDARARSSSHASLFEGLQNGGAAAWSKWFGRYLRNELQIVNKDFVYHSLRHNFTDALRQSRTVADDDLEKALLGHANQGVHGGYGAKKMAQRWGMNALIRAVEGVEYKKLDLSRVRPFALSAR